MKIRIANSELRIAEKRAGFTLVELLVSVALFSVIVAIAVGGFAGALRTQRQVASLLTADTNISLAIEQLTREVRTGGTFCPVGGNGTSLCDCQGSDPTSGALVCQALAFTNADGQQVVYNNQGGVLMKSEDGGNNFLSVTASNTIVSYFSVLVFGNTANDHWNPRITINLGVTPKEATLSGQILHLQTTVSARSIDCDANGNC